MKYTTQIPFRIGQGYDVHRLQAGRACVIGGLTFDHDFGPLGHSDGDVLLHAICDALLGALALGDIGTHFSDKDEQFKNKDSRYFVQHCLKLIKSQGYLVGNLDSIIICEAPRIGPRRIELQENVAKLLEVSAEQISIKATTEEGMGFTGTREGISAWATVLLIKSESA